MIGRVNFMLKKLKRFLIPNLNLIYGGPLTLDGWRWISSKLPPTVDDWTLLDIGCGSGAYTIKAATKGYIARGFSWNASATKKCTMRAKLVNLENCTFDTFDARVLDKYPYGNYDVIINSENIEHISDDLKLMRDIFSKLKPGGFLLLTSPYYFYNVINSDDLGPFSKFEDGGHVRRGYSKTMLEELCAISGFKVEEITIRGGLFSQLLEKIIRNLNFLLGVKLTWLLTLPLRLFPIIFDPFVRKVFQYKDYKICLVAYKPRFSEL